MTPPLKVSFVVILALFAASKMVRARRLCISLCDLNQYLCVFVGFQVL
jgi:hypothetical protein